MIGYMSVVYTHSVNGKQNAIGTSWVKRRVKRTVSV